MLKKSLLSIAVTASLVGLSGCNISSTTDNAGAKPSSQAANEAAKEALGVTPVFDAVQSKLPLGIDLIFAKAGATDGTADTGRAGTRNESPVSNAIDRLDGGIGISAPIDIPMSGSVDADQSFAGKVFLIALANADTDPLITSLDVTDILGQGLSAVQASQPAYGTDYRVETISVDGGEDNVIRIVPLEPLQPKTKYLAVVTTGVVDADGNAIGVNQNYTDLMGDAPLVVPALGGVRNALQAWSGLANGYFAAAVAGSLLPAVPTISSISAHTTVSTNDVPLGLANPTVVANAWVQGAILRSVKADVKAAAVTAETDGDFTGTWAQVQAAAAAAGSSVTAAQAGVTGLIAQANGADVETFSTIQSRETAFLPSSFWVDDATFGGVNGGKVIQGQIKLPYYLSAPAEQGAVGEAAAVTGAAAVSIQNTPMTGDTTLGDIFKTVLATGQLTAAGVVTGSVDTQAELDAVTAAKATLTIPPVDTDGKSYVNGSYPFAEKTTDVYAPVMVHLPDTVDDGNNVDCGSAAGTPCPVVVFVHGIGGNRTNMLPFANGGLVPAGHAAVSIDLPLHGIAPLDPGLSFSLDAASSVSNGNTHIPTLLSGASIPTFDNVRERHFGYGATVQGVATPLVYDDAATTEVNEAEAATKLPTLMNNASAANFINLQNFAVTRDLLRQSSMDLMNLIASLATMDVDGDTMTPDFDVNEVHVAGISLGSIIATNLVDNIVSANATGLTIPDVQTLSLSVPGGQLTRLLENSIYFAGDANATSPVNADGSLNPEFGLLAKLKAAGIPQETSNFEAFMNVFQAMVDEVDPINNAAAIATANIPTLVIEVIGDGDTEIVEGVAINLPDQVIPNSVDPDTLGLANPAPLAGTEPLVKQFNLTANINQTNGANPGARQVMRLTKGTHSSLLSTAGDASGDAVEQAQYAASANAQGVQIEAMASFIASDGAAVQVQVADPSIVSATAP
jgi:pimeloyl-ACP methyl ester carboxylesterase